MPKESRGHRFRPSKIVQDKEESMRDMLERGYMLDEAQQVIRDSYDGQNLSYKLAQEIRDDVLKYVPVDKMMREREKWMKGMGPVQTRERIHRKGLNKKGRGERDKKVSVDVHKILKEHGLE